MSDAPSNTSAPSDLDSGSDRDSGSRLDRWPMVPAFAAGAAVLCITHGIFGAALHATSALDISATMARFGVMVGFLTALFLLPVLWLGRRVLPAWKRGERARASQDVWLFAAVAVSVWMVAVLVTTQLDAGPFALPVATLVAVALAVAAVAWLQVPERVVRLGLWLTPLMVVAVMQPYGPGGPPPAPADDSGDEVQRLRPQEDAPALAPDVILLSIDTLRADRLGAYGHEPTLTPNLDRLAAEGALFERTLASSPWTVPSVASMLTGLPASRHGAGMPFSAGPTFKRSSLAPEQVTVAERFATAGYRTHALVTNGFVISMGVVQGFDEMVDVLGGVLGPNFGRDFPLVRLLLNFMPSGDYRAEALTDMALERLATEGDGPLFLWVHYIDPHVPYQADPSKLDVDAWTRMAMGKHQHEPLEDGTIVDDAFTLVEQVRSGQTWLTETDRERMRTYYDRSVTYVDQEVGRLVDAVRNRESERGVVLALTSDHGEELWDHGGFEHGHNYFREVTQVPLILWGDGVPAGTRVADVVGLVDVAPTLIDLAGFQVPPAEVDEGRSLAPLLSPPAEPVDGSTEGSPITYSAAPPRFSGGNLYGLPSVLVEEGQWRCVLRANGTLELYDVETDPEERFNVADRHPEVAEHYRILLQPRLDIFLAGKSGSLEDMSPEALEALRSLGYAQ